MTPQQCKMARAALDIGVREFAAKADVGVSSVSRFEKGGNITIATLDAMRSTFESEGIQFISDSETSTSGGVGVRLKSE